ncbi:MAG: replication-associated recombination protein A [Patescibacteria group bacterium]|nr:replication-associated recombination protein A [Patescibacteria group bacterium]
MDFPTFFPEKSTGGEPEKEAGGGLASQMRPQTLDDFVGQEHLLGSGKLLRQAIDSDQLFSMIFWGPPGVGKTTLARIIAKKTRAHFVHFSAVTSGVNEVRKIVEEARIRLKTYQQKTILFVDELHRFSKSQQDAFLPHVEDGIITLIGATTENPSFEVTTPLLSRSKVLVFNSLTEENIKQIIQNALKKTSVKIEQKALNFLVEAARGDARVALNALELALNLTRQEEEINLTSAEEATQHKHLQYDRAGEEHYNLISAVHKSMRGSDPDAAIYYVMRMLEAGEDPIFIARRLVRFASEDIGNADPQALTLAVSAFQACQMIGLPECKVILVQLSAYLALANKDNSAYIAEKKVLEDVQKYGPLPVPIKLRNASTKLMKELNYGKGYKYAHDFSEEELKGEVYLPEKLKGKKYYFKKAQN